VNLNLNWNVFTNVNFSEDRVVDEFLVMRCQTGDRTALSALIMKWQPPFLRYASVMTGDNDLAADVLQDAWIKIIKSLPRLRDPLKFPAWAYRIVNNQCLDALRKRKKQDELTDRQATAPFLQLEDQDQVWWVLAQLTPEHRSVLALHYLQGFEVKEIARIVRTPQGTVKSRLFNAREKFKEAFLNQAGESGNGDDHERIGRKNTSGSSGSYRTAR
jgi:RNA polymerase sigma factor (sigma-70 family)